MSNSKADFQRKFYTDHRRDVCENQDGKIPIKSSSVEIDGLSRCSSVNRLGPRWLEFHQMASPARWPRLAKIRARIEADSAVRFALAVEGGDTPTTGIGACRGHVSLKEVIERFGS